MTNPLLNDRDVSFLLYDVFDAASLLALPHFADHSRETFDGYIGLCARFAHETVFPAFKALDEEPPRLVDGQVFAHPCLHDILPKMREVGVFAASRPFDVGGQQLPLTIATAAHLYIMAANPAVYSFAGLSTGAAHLIEAFGSDDLKARYMTPLYEGRFTGTMALTEPHAGSSLADVSTRATPAGDHFLLSGSKIFISGGDHDLTENIVHLVLARIDGASAGIKGVSLFVVPKRRVTDGGLEGNDVKISGLVHKIGWRCLPAVILSLGEAGDCRGWLVGEPHQGIPYMFQMMNEARISIGADGVAGASVGYHESLSYAASRPQGRPVTSKDPRLPQVPILEHADVRRMLLRQKAIVEGGLGLVLQAALCADRARHAATEPERQHAQLLLDLLTPVAKSFPAEKGFESNALALQIHGGYGYTSEYLPEAWLRDQKLNSIHEGTTGIQGLDLLGRKVMAKGGAALVALETEVSAACRRAEAAGVDAAWVIAVRHAGASLNALTRELGARGSAGDVEGMLCHSADYLELFSTYAVAWQWLLQAAAAKEGLAKGGEPRDHDHLEGKLAAAQYWIRTELPKNAALVTLCRENEDSYARMKPGWF
ncbi:MAG: acyl-CoA dehydrogenase [Acidobacteriota bacterium]|nr:acyl-CoA dehydrogenase [Acidobacteriota bacterium]